MVHSPIRGSSLVRGSWSGIVVAPLVVGTGTVPGVGARLEGSAPGADEREILQRLSDGETGEQIATARSPRPERR
jgi:hypothetical protein